MSSLSKIQVWNWTTHQFKIRNMLEWCDTHLWGSTLLQWLSQEGIWLFNFPQTIGGASTDIHGIFPITCNWVAVNIIILQGVFYTNSNIWALWPNKPVPTSTWSYGNFHLCMINLSGGDWCVIGSSLRYLPSNKKDRNVRIMSGNPRKRSFDTKNNPLQ